MTGFQQPNHTQTPNELFDTYLPVLGNAELRVVLAIIRETFGWQDKKSPTGRRLSAELSISELAARTGLSQNGVMAGLRKAQERGLVRRVNPGTRASSRWEIVSKIPPSATEGLGKKSLSQRGSTPSVAEGQLPLKERNKEDLKKSPSPAYRRDGHSKPQNQPQPMLARLRMREREKQQ